MFHLARWVFTGLFAWQLWRACAGATADLSADVSNAGNFAMAIITGVAAAITWAPVIGDLVSKPITAPLTSGVPAARRGKVIRYIRRLEAGGWRRTALGLCFLEGARRPDLPGAFLMGLRNSRPGSWTEKVFAKEVYRFNNIANCIKAREILMLRHDFDPGLHDQPEINLILLAQRREARPPAVPVVMPPSAPRPVLSRNPRIRIFEKPGVPLETDLSRTEEN